MDWYYPSTPAEAARILEEEGHMPHGGGTGLLRRGFRDIRGLVDLSGLKLKESNSDEDWVYLGSGLTFSETVETLSALWEDCILIRSLSRAAATPLRNRITLGGSIADFPLWSDLMGPLYALGAEIEIYGEEEPLRFPLKEYLDGRHKERKGLITGLYIPFKRWQSWYGRYTRVTFDYPMLNISILLKPDAGIIRDIRIVIVGTTSKMNRLKELEEYLINRPLSMADISLPEEMLHFSFPRRKGISPEYLHHHASVLLERGLSEIIRGSIS